MRRANGTGTVYKLSGKRRKPWVAAKNKVIIGYFESKKSATEALERLVGFDVNNMYNLTFAEVYNLWSKEHFPKVKDEHVYRWAFLQMEKLHTRKFRNLRARDFQAVIDANSNLAPSTQRHLKNLIVQMSNWAVREEIISTSFAKFIELPVQKKKERQIFTEEEIEKIKQDDSEEARVTLMMVYTGMRIGELFDITPNDIYKDYLIGGEKTESGKNRTIPIPLKVKPYFDWFIKNGGLPWNIQRFRRLYHLMLSRLEITYKPPHSCRHTFASICRKANVPPEILQKIMGHANYETTADIYVHKDREDLINAVMNI